MRGIGTKKKTTKLQVLVQEDHRHIPPSLEYSPGNAGKNIKIHSRKTDAQQQHNNFEKRLQDSKNRLYKCSGLYSVLSENSLKDKAEIVHLAHRF